MKKIEKEIFGSLDVLIDLLQKAKIEQDFNKEDIEEFCRDKFCNILHQTKEKFPWIKESVIEELLTKYAIHSARTYIIHQLMREKKQNREKVYQDLMKDFKKIIFLVLEDWDNEQK